MKDGTEKNIESITQGDEIVNRQGVPCTVIANSPSLVGERLIYGFNGNYFPSSIITDIYI